MELRDFSWSSSPKQSVAQLGAIVRSRACDDSICFVWLCEVDRWLMKPAQAETANVATLLHRAASGAGVEVVLLDNDAVFTPSPADVFTPLTVFITVNAADADAALADVSFSADVLLPLHVRYLGDGNYAVTIYAPLPFRNLGNMALVETQRLFSPITIRAERNGYAGAETEVHIVGDENVLHQYRVKLEKR